MSSPATGAAPGEPSGQATDRVPPARLVLPGPAERVTVTPDELREIVTWAATEWGLADDETATTVAEYSARELRRRHPRQAAPLLFHPAVASVGRYLAAPAPQRRYVISDLLPAGIVALLAAPGGAGKSQLILQLLVSVALGIPWLGSRIPEPGRAIYLAAEDDEDELHRRTHSIVSHLERTEPVDRDALADRLYVVSRAADANLLTRSSPDGEVVPTELVDRLIETARSIPDLRIIVIDPISRFRGGNANHEEDATRFVEALERIRAATGATVMGTAHVNKAGVRAGGGQEVLRGSTALVDGVRWVGTLARVAADQADEVGIAPGEADRYLRFDIPKSNYTAPYAGAWLRREAGGVLTPAILTASRADRDRERAEREYLDVVARIQRILADDGPMTTRALRDRYAGIGNLLGMSDRRVRAAVERAVRDGSLREEHAPGGHLLLAPDGSSV